MYAPVVPRASIMFGNNLARPRLLGHGLTTPRCLRNRDDSLVAVLISSILARILSSSAIAAAAAAWKAVCMFVLTTVNWSPIGFVMSVYLLRDVPGGLFQNVEDAGRSVRKEASIAALVPASSWSVIVLKPWP